MSRGKVNRAATFLQGVVEGNHVDRNPDSNKKNYRCGDLYLCENTLWQRVRYNISNLAVGNPLDFAGQE